MGVWPNNTHLPFYRDLAPTKHQYDNRHWLLRAEGDRLFVNADVRTGRLLVEVFDAEGRTVPGYVWETAVWICVSGRKLVKRPDGTHRIIPSAQVQADDKVLPNELRPCTVSVRDDGIYEFREASQPTNVSVYYRGDPRENEAALREALPALYLAFHVTSSKN